MRLVVDVMGDPTAPRAAIKGSKAMLSKYPDLEIILYGVEKEIEKNLIGRNPSGLRFFYSKDAILPEDLSSAARHKRNSSMVKSAELVRDDIADGMVSSGNTPALVAAATFKLGRIDGVQAPALTARFPTVKGEALVLDVGAIKDCTPKQLVQLAIMAREYLRSMGIENPTVGLLSIGSEESKGNNLVVATHKFLKENNFPGFVGNIEPAGIFAHEADIILADGFSGNILIKAIEAILSFIARGIKKRIRQNLFMTAYCLITLPLALPFLLAVLLDIVRKIDPNRYDGAPLLGLKKLCVKAHGSSSARGFANAIETAYLAVKGQGDYANSVTEALSIWMPILDKASQ